MELPKRAIDKSEMMLLDMLAHFDWKRPIHFTQVYTLQSLGLLDYLQFDGYTYRLVPIYTPCRNVQEIGRVDPDYVTPLLTETFRYGNLSDPRTYADHTIQHTLSASKAREDVYKRQIENPVANATLSAKCNDSWITDIDTKTSGVISFNVTKNETAEKREAIIEVSYADIQPAPSFKVKQTFPNAQPEIVFAKELSLIHILRCTPFSLLR